MTAGVSIKQQEGKTKVLTWDPTGKKRRRIASLFDAQKKIHAQLLIQSSVKGF